MSKSKEYKFPKQQETTLKDALPTLKMSKKQQSQKRLLPSQQESMLKKKAENSHEKSSLVVASDLIEMINKGTMIKVLPRSIVPAKNEATEHSAVLSTPADATIKQNQTEKILGVPKHEIIVPLREESHKKILVENGLTVSI